MTSESSLSPKQKAGLELSTNFRWWDFDYVDHPILVGRT